MSALAAWIRDQVDNPDWAEVDPELMEFYACLAEPPQVLYLDPSPADPARGDQP